MARVAAELGIGKTPVTVIAPQGVARLLLLDLPPGVEAVEFARFRFSDLPYPAAEAVVDVLPVRGGRASRPPSAGWWSRTTRRSWPRPASRQERLDLTSLAALSGLLKDAGGSGPVLDVILGDAAYAMAAHRDGVLSVLRHRRRDRRDGEAARLRAEAERTAALAGAPLERVRVVGTGAAAPVPTTRSRPRGAPASAAVRSASACSRSGSPSRRSRRRWRSTDRTPSRCAAIAKATSPRITSRTRSSPASPSAGRPARRAT